MWGCRNKTKCWDQNTAFTNYIPAVASVVETFQPPGPQKLNIYSFLNYLAFGIFLKSNTNELRQIPTINLHSGCEPRDPSCFYGWLCFAHLPVLGARWNNSPPLDSTTVQQRGNSKNLVRGQDCCKSQGDDSDDMEVSAGRSTSTTDMSVSLTVQLNQWNIHMKIPKNLQVKPSLRLFPLSTFV